MCGFSQSRSSLWTSSGPGLTSTSSPFLGEGGADRFLSPSGLLWKNTTGQVTCEQRRFTSYSSGGWTSGIRVPASIVEFWQEPTSGLPVAVFSLCPHMSERRVSFWGFLSKGADLSHEGPPPNTITLRVRVVACGYLGGHIQPPASDKASVGGGMEE